MRTGKVLLFLCGLILIGCVVGFAEPEEKLSEKDQIIANLRKNIVTHKEEIAKIRQSRQTQISALVQLLSDVQKDISEMQYKKFRYVNYCENSIGDTIDLLGELRAAEAAEPIIDAFCFEIDRLSWGAGEDTTQWYIRLISTTEIALAKIGKPSVSLLINVLKGMDSRYVPTDIASVDKEIIESKNERNYAIKAKVARKIIYLIEGECAIHHLEKALREETDEKKKANLSESIAKFREELKSGTYTK